MLQTTPLVHRGCVFITRIHTHWPIDTQEWGTYPVIEHVLSKSNISLPILVSMHLTTVAFPKILSPWAQLFILFKSFKLRELSYDSLLMHCYIQSRFSAMIFSNRKTILFFLSYDSPAITWLHIMLMHSVFLPKRVTSIFSFSSTVFGINESSQVQSIEILILRNYTPIAFLDCSDKTNFRYSSSWNATNIKDLFSLGPSLGRTWRIISDNAHPELRIVNAFCCCKTYNALKRFNSSTVDKNPPTRFIRDDSIFQEKYKMHVLFSFC